MFQRGDIVQRKSFGDFRGVVVATKPNQISVNAFGAVTGVFSPDEFELAPKQPEDDFRAALALGDADTMLKLYRAAQAERATDLFYVYRHDSYEPGDLEYYNPFETIDEAKREIENGLPHEDMSIYRAHNNVLTEILKYDYQWNADTEQWAHRWVPVGEAEGSGDV